MNATDYTANLRDQRFVLFEQIKVQDLCKLPKFQDFDKETFDAMLVEAAKISENVMGPINAPGDKEGCSWDPETKAVTTPAGVKDMWKKFTEAGFQASGGDPEYGGMGLPPVLASSFNEFFAGSNISASLYPLLIAGAGAVIELFGHAEMKQKYLPKMYAGEWGATMVLTEPGAGSDVGNSKTKASRIEGEDAFIIAGDKIFITGGDHDLAKNIIHLVLARIEGAPKGTKGLSLFVVPKFLVNEDGSLGDHNDVICTGIEHKMGIKASATCSLAFGDEGKCRGWLIGEEGQGMKIMFNMMNLARIETGMGATGLGASAYFNALSYAKERLQGSSLKDFKNADAPRVPIIEHPDVRRMLMHMKAQLEANRYILLKTGLYESLSHAETDEAAKDKANDFLELLTPICKAYCTDRGFEVCSTSMQVYGGYGYTNEYPVEQTTRDARILPIYEGANGIQAMDLLGRKIGMKKGMVLMNYIEELGKDLDAAKAIPGFLDVAEDYEKAKDEFINVAMNLSMFGLQGKFGVALKAACDLLKLMGHVVGMSGLVEGSVVANTWLQDRYAKEGIAADDMKAQRAFYATNLEAQFYAGKLASARFFAKNVLPEVYALSSSILSEDKSCFEPVL